MTWGQHGNSALSMYIYRMKTSDNIEKFVTEKIADWYFKNALYEKDYTQDCDKNPHKAVWTHDPFGSAPTESEYPIKPTNYEHIMKRLKFPGYVEFCIEEEEDGILPNLYMFERIEVEGEL